MAFSYFTQLFTDGMNKDIDPGALDLSAQNATMTKVADSANMLFERGLATSRPGLVAVAGPPGALPAGFDLVALNRAGLAPRADFSAGHPLVGPWALVFDPGAGGTRIYKLNPYLASSAFLDPTQITKAGVISFSDLNHYGSFSVVNGVIMIGGMTGGTGLLRWDPTATVFTNISTAPYRYVVGHLSRGVAAYDQSYSTAGYPATVAWSVPGDETKWGAAFFANGAGISVLGDVNDAITGLGVANGFVVVARTYGFHLGIPTGATPPYDWRRMHDVSVGVMHPATLQIYKNTLFFMSGQGIHMYDLVNITDIGEGIYKEITGLIQQYNLVPRGFMSAGYSTDFQPSYNLVLDSASALTQPQLGAIPHYMFNLKEQKWSRHFYPFDNSVNAWTNLAFCPEYIPNPGFGAADPAPIPSIVVYKRTHGSSPVPSQWSPGAALEAGQSAYVTTGQITLDDVTKDLQVERLLLVYNAPSGGPYTITVAITAVLNGASSTVTKTISTYAAGGWDRRWINFRVTGGFLQVKVTIPAACPPLSIKAIAVEYTAVGKVRT